MREKLSLHRHKQAARQSAWHPIAQFQYGDERLTPEQVADAVADRTSTRVFVQDPYDRRRFSGAFYVDALTLGIYHRTQQPQFNIGAFSLIHNGVQVDDRAEIGRFVELQPRATVKARARISDQAVMLKGSYLGENSTLGSGVISAGVLGKNTSVALGTVVERNAYIAQGAHVGTQGLVGRRTVIGPRASIGDSVIVADDCLIGAGAILDHGATLGYGVRAYHDVVIGENAQIGHYNVIGAHAIIGAEVQIGESNVFAPTAWVQAGAIIAARDTEAHLVSRYRRP